MIAQPTNNQVTFLLMQITQAATLDGFSLHLEEQPT